MTVVDSSAIKFAGDIFSSGTKNLTEDADVKLNCCQLCEFVIEASEYLVPRMTKTVGQKIDNPTVCGTVVGISHELLSSRTFV